MIVQVDKEMNLGWATAHPELFAKTFVEFQASYPSALWDHSIDLSRDKYVTLTAKRKEQ